MTNIPAVKRTLAHAAAGPVFRMPGTQGAIGQVFGHAGGEFLPRHRRGVVVVIRRSDDGVHLDAVPIGVSPVLLLLLLLSSSSTIVLGSSTWRCVVVEEEASRFSGAGARGVGW